MGIVNKVNYGVENVTNKIAYIGDSTVNKILFNGSKIVSILNALGDDTRYKGDDLILTGDDSQYNPMFGGATNFSKE